MSPKSELKKVRDTLLFTAGVFALTFLAFVTTMLLQGFIAGGLIPDTVRLMALAAIFTGVVFASGVLLQLPLLTLLRYAHIGRAATIFAGALLGIVPVVIVLILFRVIDDVRALATYMRFWQLSAAGVVLDLAPYVAAGAAIGWYASRPRAVMPQG